MPGLEENSRIATRLVRPIEIRCNEVAWQALEDHFLDGVGLILDPARGSWIERPLVVWQAAQNLHKFFANHFFPVLRAGDRMDFSDSFFPALQMLLRNPVHPLEKWVGLALLSMKKRSNKKSGTQQPYCGCFHEDLPEWFERGSARVARDESSGVLLEQSFLLVFAQARLLDLEE